MSDTASPPEEVNGNFRILHLWEEVEQNDGAPGSTDILVMAQRQCNNLDFCLLGARAQSDGPIIRWCFTLPRCNAWLPSKGRGGWVSGYSGGG